MKVETPAPGYAERRQDLLRRIAAAKAEFDFANNFKNHHRELKVATSKYNAVLLEFKTLLLSELDRNVTKSH